MRVHNSQEGQTLVETAVVLFLLLLIILGIAEFSRAWYIKNSLKNAVRQGARVAAIIPVDDLDLIVNINQDCPPGDCDAMTGLDPVVSAVCCQPGIPRRTDNNTSFTLTYSDEDEIEGLTQDDFIIVTATTKFTFIVGDKPWPWPKTIDFIESASMRYEVL